jgi:protein SCO1
MLNIMRQKNWASVAARTVTAAALFAGALSALTMGSAVADENPYGANYFPNVTLINQDGKAIKFYDEIKGKSVAINVIYTSCRDECPLETAKLAQVTRIFGNKMGKDIFFYSISIDPEHDTPEVLKAYAKNFNTGPGWQFLTGNPEDIKVLVKKLGLSKNSDKANKDGHSASMMVGNEPTGQWTRHSAVDNPTFLSSAISSFLGFRVDPEKRTNYAEMAPLAVAPGQYLFQGRCSACHSIGDGAKIGPDLAGLTKRRERSWVARYMMEPEKMRNEGDPTALALGKSYTVRMPDQRLGVAELTDILAYLEKQSDAPRKTAQKDSAIKEAANEQQHVHQH